MIDGLTHMMGVLTGWVAILMPVLLLWVIFYYKTREEKENNRLKDKKLINLFMLQF